MSKAEPVISASLRTREAFKKDLKALSELSVACLTALNSAVAQSNGAVTVKEAEQIARNAQQDAGKAVRAVSMLHFLRSRAVKVSASPPEVFEEVSEVLGADGLTVDPALIACFDISDADRRELLARDAFSVGQSYLACGIKAALMRADDPAKTMVGGFVCTISYSDAGGSEESITFGLTRTALKALVKQLSDADTEYQSIVSTIG